MDLEIKGKVAFVGGASSGLGEAVAKQLAEEGVSVFLCARGLEGLERVKRDINKCSQVDVFLLQADLSIPEDVQRAVQETLQKVDHIDILFNNTGGPPSGKFEDTSTEQWDSAYQLLLSSVVNLTKGFLPGMKKQKWGRVIFSTSVTVKQPADNLILSNSLRAAVTGLARTLANEVAAEGVTVNCVLPGYTMTPRIDYLAKRKAELEGITYEQAIEQWTSSIPMRRIGEPHEFAAMVAFLASMHAAYITGQSVAIDGGSVKSLY